MSTASSELVAGGTEPASEDIRNWIVTELAKLQEVERSSNRSWRTAVLVRRRFHQGAWAGRCAGGLA